MAGVTSASSLRSLFAQEEEAYSLSTFSADVTPPIGHPLIAGWRQPAKTIKDKLSACGLILQGEGTPIVICSVDWCELRNDAYDRWREALAQAVGTSRERVLVHCVHQHDAPYADLEAQRILDEHGYPKMMFDPEFHETMVQRVAKAAKDSLKSSRPISHIGTGETKIDGIACNRRTEIDGKVHFNRGSFTRDLRIRSAHEGEIDPMLKMLTFYDGDQAVAQISCYATHPMSYYGRGEVSYDFPGMARVSRQADNPDVFQIYMTGCSGDLTAAKFNSGDEKGRIELGERLAEGMEAASKATKRTALEKVDFRLGSLNFEPRVTGNHDPARAQSIIENPKSSVVHRTQAALTLSWQKRVASGQAIDLPVIDFGMSKFTLLPAESFVGYQLAAQKMRPDNFVMTPGFGECAPGYIPTDKTEKEGFVKNHGYDWVAPMPEKTILDTLRKVL